MKNLGKITDPKDIITKEYIDEGIGKTVNTLEDNVAMAESDIETLQGDVQSLQTDNTATKAAVKTLQDTYVPNTRKVNNKALDADITLSASDVGALSTDYKPVWVITGDYNLATNKISNIDKTYTDIKAAINNGYQVELRLNIAGLGVISLPYTTTDLNNKISFEGDSITNSEIVHAWVLVDKSNKWDSYMFNALTRYDGNNYDADGYRISSLAAPENDTDAANKQYVDNLKPSTYQNVTVATTAWVANTNSQAADQEKTDYPFMATISLTGVTANQMATVLFNYDDQIGGNFAPCAYTTSGGVIIEAKEKPSATITLASVTIMSVSVK